METRKPTTQEIARWNRFKKYFETVTGPRVKALGVLAMAAQKFESDIEQLTGTRPIILSDTDKSNITEIQRRGAIMDRLITSVLTNKYGVQFNENGVMSIVGNQADEGDIYPRDEIELGVVWWVVIGVVAVVLLVNSDQSNKRLANDSENVAVRMQDKMVAQDIKLLNAPKDVRDRWAQMKQETAKAARAALRESPTQPGWFSKIFGDKGTSMLIAGAVGIAAIYFLVPMMRRN